MAAETVVRPGDTLLVGISSDDHDLHNLTAVKSEIESYLPGVKVVMIFGATMLAVVRAEPEPEGM